MMANAPFLASLAFTSTLYNIFSKASAAFQHNDHLRKGSSVSGMTPVAMTIANHQKGIGLLNQEPAVL